ncbi:phosphate ABC transporter permease PstA [Sphingomicrobium sediminis]|uniref:Phosphate transport system permease protein PstA n=1 Tax=Sphingomicrobium sediminis TaxID=2950949 RepID=A0A9X2EHH8_9SPHN|nr:phosphate ABC transporter permease PstA [Sphingomicrobium sediminis]MCM8557660.1 phosphate ABC transporter permease PstA [Sphingomicrobium sediminis]
MNSPTEKLGAAERWTSEAMQRRVKQRYAAERRFKMFGMAAVGLSVAFLAFLLVNMATNGFSGFFRTEASVTVNFPASDVMVDPASLEGDDARSILSGAGLRGAIREAAVDTYGEAGEELFGGSAVNALTDMLVDDPDMLMREVDIMLPVTSEVDLAHKGDGSAAGEALAALAAERGTIDTKFNWTFLTASDATNPGEVGIWGALVGSFLTIIVTMLLAFPIGVLSAVYLEEFAPKNKWTDMVEVSINNLAAVPSIIFGLLGLAVFLNFMHLPRSAPLVGGLTLALMTMPVIVIAGRNAIKAVPPSIRDAALGVGASKMQVVFHHVLPLALPGILTGTIIGMARALGETAPLLLIGMRAFVSSPPTGIMSDATVLPMQIFLWSDEVDRGFVEKTSAAIIVLLLFMLAMNALAIYLRNRFEQRW